MRAAMTWPPPPGMPAVSCRLTCWPCRRNTRLISCSLPSEIPSRARLWACWKLVSTPPSCCRVGTSAPIFRPTASLKTVSIQPRLPTPPRTTPQTWSASLSVAPLPLRLRCRITALRSPTLPSSAMCRCLKPRFPPPRPVSFPAPWWSPCARFRPRRSPMPCGLPPVTHQFTAPRSTWVTRRPLALRICPAPTLAIRAKCQRAACRSFGPVV